MPQPDAGPATSPGVKGFLKITDTDDDAELADIVAAVNAVVRGLPVAVVVDAAAWPANITRGANMLAGRLFRRRATPSGVEAFGVDGVVYVSRNDPDIAMLLELGPYARPAVG
jgi:hypothetical protein